MAQSSTSCRLTDDSECIENSRENWNQMYQSMLLAASAEDVAQHIAANLDNASLAKAHAFTARSFGLQFTDQTCDWSPEDEYHKMLTKLLPLPSLVACLGGPNGAKLANQPLPLVHVIMTQVM